MIHVLIGEVLVLLTMQLISVEQAEDKRLGCILIILETHYDLTLTN